MYKKFKKKEEKKKEKKEKNIDVVKINLIILIKNHCINLDYMLDFKKVQKLDNEY